MKLRSYADWSVYVCLLTTTINTRDIVFNHVLVYEIDYYCSVKVILCGPKVERIVIGCQQLFPHLMNRLVYNSTWWNRRWQIIAVFFVIVMSFILSTSSFLPKVERFVIKQVNGKRFSNQLLSFFLELFFKSRSKYFFFRSKSKRFSCYYIKFSVQIQKSCIFFKNSI